MKRFFLLLTALLTVLPLGARAHFQLIHTPEVNPGRPGSVPLKLIFWHPFDNGPVMDMARPEQFFVSFRGKRSDLLDSLKPITFQGAENSAAAFDASLPVTRNGDYVIGLIPAPYLEKSEDVYIQQFTKVVVNVGKVPGGWDQPLGLPAEIQPLTRPTNVLAGSSFSGRVMADGKPVPGARLEVEYMAAEPDMTANRPRPATAAPLPGGAIQIIADQGGNFTFGIPKAGFWGFAALGVGAKKKHQGKDLSQDAVLWIRAYDLTPKEGR